MDKLNVFRAKVDKYPYDTNTCELPPSLNQQGSSDTKLNQSKVFFGAFNFLDYYQEKKIPKNFVNLSLPRDTNLLFFD